MNWLYKDELYIYDLLKNESIKFGDFTLRSGKKSDFYIDCRPLILSSLGRKLISQCFYAHVNDGSFFAATGVGGSYIASGVSDLYGTGVIHVRDEKKDHGTRNKLEIPYKFNKEHNQVVIVDDVLTSGSSLITCISSLLEDNICVTKCLVLVDREEGGKEIIEQNYGVRVESIFLKSDFMKEQNY